MSAQPDRDGQGPIMGQEAEPSGWEQTQPLPRPGDGTSASLSAEQLVALIAQELQVATGQQIVHVERLAEREPEFASPSPPLPASLQGALGNLGISRLYVHQVESLQRIREGQNIVVVTATSSGKTLCYNLPVFEHMLQNRDTRALYVYPINALVNDQLKSLFKMNLALGKEALGIARYTGSMSSEKRKDTRARNPNIFLTNPEMLHLSFLLWHQNWEDLWRNLGFIIVDEVHTYRGVFGSNMAQLFRRMLRMAAYYGASPQFICCSATIANPKALVESLIGREFSVVDHDGAGRGRKHFVLWNPPLQSVDGANVRRSYAEESVDLLLQCVRANYNTILFARARRLTERMVRLGRAWSQERGESALMEQVCSYRAGYLTEEREEIEGKLRVGDIKGIITTNALEMGIDIGGLDAAIISGYPGTIMSTWQQAGRAGRRGRDAVAFLVASQNPLDQYYMNHPQEFFAQPHELAVVDLENPHIRLKHLLCAARELPLSSAEIEAMPANVRDLVEQLRSNQLLEPSDSTTQPDGLTYAQTRRDIHFGISLRSAGHETFRILDQDRNEIGTIEPPNVYREAHPGAIYQHGDDDYRVTFLDRHQKTVLVREENAPHYTRSQSMLSLRVGQIHASRVCVPERDGMGLPFVAAMGDVQVEERIFGYQELRLGSEEMVKRVNLDHPIVIRLHTTAMWIALPPAVETLPTDWIGAEGSAEDQPDHSWLVEGLHAAEHLITGVMPLLVMCDRRDIDGFHQTDHPDLHCPALFVYDAYEGGIGLAEVAYQRVEDLLRLANDTVVRCNCVAGCPSCIQSGVCRQHNESLSKAASKLLLSLLLGQNPDDEPSVALAGIVAPGLPSYPQTAADQDIDLGKKRALSDLLDQTRRKGIQERVAQVPRESRGPEESFVKGEWVEHSTFGRGVVLDVRVDGQKRWISVRFMRRGTLRELDSATGGLRKVAAPAR